MDKAEYLFELIKEAQQKAKGKAEAKAKATPTPEHKSTSDTKAYSWANSNSQTHKKPRKRIPVLSPINDYLDRNIIQPLQMRESRGLIR